MTKIEQIFAEIWAVKRTIPSEMLSVKEGLAKSTLKLQTEITLLRLPLLFEILCLKVVMSNTSYQDNQIT